MPGAAAAMQHDLPEASLPALNPRSNIRIYQ
jgi:hypothetical protein